MNRDEIISSLFTGKNFNSCLAKMKPDYLREDLKMEVICCVCEWPEEKILKLHTDRVLEFYVVRVILNQIKSISSPFARKFRSFTYELNGYDIAEEIDLYAIADRQTREALKELTMAQINEWCNSDQRTDKNGHWYRGNMLKLYLEAGTYRAMEKKTGIPHISCFKSVQSSIVLLKRTIVQERIEPAGRTGGR